MISRGIRDLKREHLSFLLEVIFEVALGIAAAAPIVWGAESADPIALTQQLKSELSCKVSDRNCLPVREFVLKDVARCLQSESPARQWERCVGQRFQSSQLPAELDRSLEAFYSQIPSSLRKECESQAGLSSGASVNARGLLEVTACAREKLRSAGRLNPNADQAAKDLSVRVQELNLLENLCAHHRWNKPIPPSQCRFEVRRGYQEIEPAVKELSDLPLSEPMAGKDSLAQQTERCNADRSCQSGADPHLNVELGVAQGCWNQLKCDGESSLAHLVFGGRGVELARINNELTALSTAQRYRNLRSKLVEKLFLQFASIRASELENCSQLNSALQSEWSARSSGCSETGVPASELSAQVLKQENVSKELREICERSRGAGTAAKEKYEARMRSWASDLQAAQCAAEYIDGFPGSHGQTLDEGLKEVSLWNDTFSNRECGKVRSQTLSTAKDWAWPYDLRTPLNADSPIAGSQKGKPSASEMVRRRADQKLACLEQAAPPSLVGRDFSEWDKIAAGGTVPLFANSPLDKEWGYLLGRACSLGDPRSDLIRDLQDDGQAALSLDELERLVGSSVAPELDEADSVKKARLRLAACNQGLRNTSGLERTVVAFERSCDAANAAFMVATLAAPNPATASAAAGTALACTVPSVAHAAINESKANELKRFRRAVGAQVSCRDAIDLLEEENGLHKEVRSSLISSAISAGLSGFQVGVALKEAKTAADAEIQLQKMIAEAQKITPPKRVTLPGQAPSIEEALENSGRTAQRYLAFNEAASANELKRAREASRSFWDKLGKEKGWISSNPNNALAKNSKEAWEELKKLLEPLKGGQVEGWESTLTRLKPDQLESTLAWAKQGLKEPIDPNRLRKRFEIFSGFSKDAQDQLALSLKKVEDETRRLRDSRLLSLGKAEGYPSDLSQWTKDQFARASKQLTPEARAQLRTEALNRISKSDPALKRVLTEEGALADSQMVSRLSRQLANEQYEGLLKKAAEVRDATQKGQPAWVKISGPASQEEGQVIFKEIQKQAREPHGVPFGLTDEDLIYHSTRHPIMKMQASGTADKVNDPVEYYQSAMELLGDPKAVVKVVPPDSSAGSLYLKYEVSRVRGPPLEGTEEMIVLVDRQGRVRVATYSQQLSTKKLVTAQPADVGTGQVDMQKALKPTQTTSKTVDPGTVPLEITPKEVGAGSGGSLSRSNAITREAKEGQASVIKLIEADGLLRYEVRVAPCCKTVVPSPAKIDEAEKELFVLAAPGSDRDPYVMGSFTSRKVAADSVPPSGFAFAPKQEWGLKNDLNLQKIRLVDSSEENVLRAFLAPSESIELNTTALTQGGVKQVYLVHPKPPQVLLDRWAKLGSSANAERLAWAKENATRVEKIALTGDGAAKNAERAAASLVRESVSSDLAGQVSEMATLDGKRIFRMAELLEGTRLEQGRVSQAYLKGSSAYEVKELLRVSQEGGKLQLDTGRVISGQVEAKRFLKLLGFDRAEDAHRQVSALEWALRSSHGPVVEFQAANNLSIASNTVPAVAPNTTVAGRLLKDQAVVGLDPNKGKNFMWDSATRQWVYFDP